MSNRNRFPFKSKTRNVHALRQKVKVAFPDQITRMPRNRRSVDGLRVGGQKSPANVRLTQRADVRSLNSRVTAFDEVEKACAIW